MPEVYVANGSRHKVTVRNQGAESDQAISVTIDIGQVYQVPRSAGSITVGSAQGEKILDGWRVNDGL